MKSLIVYSTLAIMVLFSSCVSKKAFLAMQTDYVSQTDSLVDVTEDLNKKLQSGELDFESTKQDLMINDASKNDQIAELENKLKELQSGFDALSHTLADTKSQVETTQSAKEQAGYQMARMNSELVALRQDTVSLNYAIKVERRKVSGLETSLGQQREKYSTDVNLHKQEIVQMKKEVEVSRLKTKELERQLSIKQKQMDEVGESFIALRKELLKAKTQGEIIDPVTNANVDKLAKSLGQY